MTGHTPWSQIKHKRDKGTRSFPHQHEGQGPRCLACGNPRSMHPDGKVHYRPKHHTSSRCMSTSPLHGYVCSMWDGHEGEHVSLDGVRWGYGARERDADQVAAMKRHTRPLVDPHEEFVRNEAQYEPELLPENIFEDDPHRDRFVIQPGDIEVVSRPDNDEDIQYLYPYQDEAAQTLEDFIASFANSFWPHTNQPDRCKHCKAREALKTLNGIIKTQYQKIRQAEDFMAIQHEMYGDPAELVTRAADLELRLHASDQALLNHGNVVAQQRNRIAVLEHDLRVASRQAEACAVELHNAKQHELGLMCAEQQDKLDKIQKLLERAPIDLGEGEWVVLDIRDILEGTDAF